MNKSNRPFCIRRVQLHAFRRTAPLFSIDSPKFLWANRHKNLLRLTLTITGIHLVMHGYQTKRGRKQSSTEECSEKFSFSNRQKYFSSQESSTATIYVFSMILLFLSFSVSFPPPLPSKKRRARLSWFVQRRICCCRCCCFQINYIIGLNVFVSHFFQVGVDLNLFSLFLNIFFTWTEFWKILIRLYFLLLRWSDSSVSALETILHEILFSNLCAFSYIHIILMNLFFNFLFLRCAIRFRPTFKCITKKCVCGVVFCCWNSPCNAVE